MNYRYWLFFIILVSPFSLASDRFKGVDLWLPTTYQKQYSTLLDAAEKAKNDPYCFQLLSGRIVEAQSTLDHMQFYFRCRTEDRRMFSIQVDGNTLVATNAFGEQQKKKEEDRLAEEQAKIAQEEAIAIQEVKEEDREMQRLLEEKVAERRKEQSRYWQICRKEMRKKLKRFDEVSILTESLPEPTIQADQFTYNVAFDAQNPRKQILHFQIICVISALDNYEISIKPRKQATEGKE